jgi:hypothetical protein
MVRPTVQPLSDEAYEAKKLDMAQQQLLDEIRHYFERVYQRGPYG